VALIGCGGRGTGATQNALSVQNGPIKLVALADVFENRLRASHGSLSKRFPDQVDVPEERQFLGFDAYKKGDRLLEAGRCRDLRHAARIPLGSFRLCDRQRRQRLHGEAGHRRRPDHQADAGTGGQVGGEEPEVRRRADGPALPGTQELFNRIQDGEIGDLIALRAYRMSGRAAAVGLPPEGMSHLMYQIQRFHSFIWASGGVFSDFYIHQIDECSWMKNAWPVQAAALGGRHYREGYVDQNLDTYSVEYTYPDGTKLFYYGRNMTGCHNEFASYAHGTKGCAIISTRSHHPGRVRTFSDQKFEEANRLWGPPIEPSPYQLEWDHLIAAIREDKPFNEVERGAIASLVTSMGRMAAHTGRIITYDEMLNCDHEMAPEADRFTADSEAPLLQRQRDLPHPATGHHHQPGIRLNQTFRTAASASGEGVVRCKKF
jgi:hypothetical protein